MSSGYNASPELPSRSFDASAETSILRLIPTTPPIRDYWNPNPNWTPGVNPAANTAANDGS